MARRVQQARIDIEESTARNGLLELVADLIDPNPQLPDIVTFAENSEFLGLGPLYPRQKTLLRLMYAPSERNLMTAYDEDVIAEWADGFNTGEYRIGVAPDIWRRIEMLEAQEREHFDIALNL
jgi:hypothetical protein